MKKLSANKLFENRIIHIKDEIMEKNHINFRRFLFTGMVISIIAFVFGLSLSGFVTFNAEFGIMFLIFVFFYFLTKWFLNKRVKNILGWFYFVESIIMILGILMGTYLDPQEPSISIMVFLCVLPIFIIDRPWRIMGFITGVAVLYTVLCFNAKEIELFKADMVDLVIFYVLSIGVNLFTLEDRISSAEVHLVLKEKAELDLLTHLYNHETGVKKINDLNCPGVFMMMDVDYFKEINDTFGHHCGDVVLQKIAVALKETLGDSVVILRLGGDEFACFIPNVLEKEEVSKLLNNILNTIKKKDSIEIRDIVIELSIGCKIYRVETVFKEMYKETDALLYLIKHNGKKAFIIEEQVIEEENDSLN